MLIVGMWMHTKTIRSHTPHWQVGVFQAVHGQTFTGAVGAVLCYVAYNALRLEVHTVLHAYKPATSQNDYAVRYPGHTYGIHTYALYIYIAIYSSVCSVMPAAW